MKILVLGGTRFVGRGIVEAAVVQGHTVSVLHRGVSAPHADPQLEHLIADRTRPETLGILAGRRWDAVIDVSGYEPEDVSRVGAMLASSVARYLFVSTAAVHRGEWGGAWDEDTPRVPAAEDSYGARKRTCEDHLCATYGERCTVLRPSIVVGPGDPDDRLGYWLRRAARGGDALAPGRPDQRLQFVDAADFGRFAVHCVEEEIAGAFDVASPPMRSDTFFEACSLATGGRVSWTFVSGCALEDAGVRTEELPHFFPYWSRADELAPYLDVRRALARGLCSTPLQETIERVLRCTEPSGERGYLDEAREGALLTRGR